MSAEEDILKGLKAKGEDFAMDVSDGLWAEIEKEIAPKDTRKKRGWLFWFSFGAIGLIALLTTFFVWTNTEQKELVFKDGANKLNKKPWELNVDAEMGTNSTTVAEKPGQSNVVQGSQDQNTPTDQERHFAATSEISPKVDERVSATADEKDTGSLKVEGEEKNELTSATENVLLSAEASSVAASSEADESEVTTTNQVDTIHQENSEKAQAVPLTDTTKRTLSNVTADTTYESLEEENAPIEKVEPAKKKPFSVMLTAGIGNSYRTLKSDVFHSLVEHKDAHESFGRAFKAGLIFDWSFKERWSLRTGFVYSHYSEHYAFHHDVIDHVTNNDYNYFKIPLRIRYRFASYKRFDFSVIPGCSWNVLQTAQSSWVDPTMLEPVAHSNADEVTPFRSGTFGLSLSLEGRFKLSEKWSFHLIPGVDGFAHSVYKRNTELIQRPFAFNGKVGLSYQF